MASSGASDILDLIELMARQSSPQSVSRLAAHYGKPKSSYHRLLRILEEKGYVERSDDSLYQLVRPVGVDGLTRDQARLVDISKSFLQQAANKSGVSTFLAVLVRPDRLRYIAKSLPSGQEMVYNRDISIDRDPVLVASGRCINAFTNQAPSSDDLAIRNAGVCINLNGVMEGAAGVASPLFDRSGSVIAAVNLAGPRHSFTGDRLERIVATCIQVSEDINLALNNTNGRK